MHIGSSNQKFTYNLNGVELQEVSVERDLGIYIDLSLQPSKHCPEAAKRAPPSYTQLEPLSFTNVTATSITVTWPAWNETIDKGHGPILEYRIQIRGPGEDEFFEEPKGGQLSHQFNNLNETTDYEFRVRIIRDHPFGDGPIASEVQTQNTSAREPPSYAQVEPLTFSDVTPTSITVTWPAWNEAIDHGYGPILEYRIQIRGQGEDEFTEVLKGGQLSHQFNDLNETTDYEFRVRIIRDHLFGDGPTSEVQPQNTSAREPPSYAQVEPLTFSDVTPTSITVTWPAWNEAIDHGYGPILEYRIQIRGQGEDEFNEVPKGGQLSHQFNDLNETTDYEFRVRIIRDHPFGDGPTSEVQTQNTSTREPPSYAQVEPLTFSDVTPTSITVTWPAWNEAIDHGYGPILEYRIQIRGQGEDEFTEVPKGGQLSHQFNDLNETTDYEFRVRIIRDHLFGDGPTSELQTQNTSTREPPAYAQAEPLTFSDVTPTSITVTWPAWNEAIDHGYGPILEYRMQIRGQGEDEFTEVPKGGQLSHQFNDLNETTDYEFRVRIIRDHLFGDGPTSEVQTQNTSTREPPSYAQAEPLTFSDVTPTSITVTWPAWNEAIDHGYGPILEYRIQIRGPGEDEFTEEPKGGQLSHQFNDLNETTDYEFRVRIIRDHLFGDGPTSEVQTQNTSTREPPAYAQVEPLTFSDVTPTSITVTWPAWNEAIDHGYGPILEYKIQIRGQGEDEFTEVPKGGQLSHQFNDLNETTDYDFRVRIIRDNPFGDGPTSKVQTQNTSAREPPSYAQVEPLTFSDVTPTSITVTWPAWNEAIDHGYGPILEYRIQIRGQGEEEFTEVPKGGQLSHQFNDLNETTDYEFRVRIIRDHLFGDGPTSEVQTQNTSTREPPSYAQVEPLTFSDVTPTSITVTWPAWNEAIDHGYGPILEYRIQIRGQGEEEFTEVPKGGQLSHQFNDLNETTDYEFRVRIIRDHLFGDGPASEVQTQNTYTNGILRAVNISISPSCGVSIQVLSSAGLQNMTGYKLEYIEENSSVWVVLEFAGTEPNQLDDLLEGGYTYEVRTSVKYGDTYSEPARIHSCIMPCKDPIINFALSSLSRRSGMASMIAEWMHRTLKDPCGVFNQSITIQQLNLDRCTGVSNLMNFKDNFDGVTRYYRKFGIRPNSEYNVTLSAITKTNIFSTSKTIQMVETAPTGSPTRIRFKSKIMRRRLMIFWDKVPCGQRNGEIISYHIKLSRGSASAVVHDTTERMAMYSGFNVGERIEVQVRAVTSAGAGPYSQVIVGTFGSDN
ncbi:putative twitchin-like [Apostichopus japonicus]|uniref:Putative twitchin-like n=1 Tax=Stichopus japonicus TaxID=307972 RepID=A0A2G8LMW6_STIJA|nr:putative twitchin-like [Apostichopus japonicus]